MKGNTMEAISAFSLAAGVALCISCFVLFQFSIVTQDWVVRFGTGILFAGIALHLVFLVFSRVAQSGERIPGYDVYRAYWRMAPQRGWSRVPVVMSLVSIVIAVIFFIYSRPH